MMARTYLSSLLQWRQAPCALLRLLLAPDRHHGPRSQATLRARGALLLAASGALVRPVHLMSAARATHLMAAPSGQPGDIADIEAWLRARWSEKSQWLLSEVQQVP